MRGIVEGLETAAPVVLRMPAIYQEDEFTNRFLRAFDDVLAPVLATLRLARGVHRPSAGSAGLRRMACRVGRRCRSTTRGRTRSAADLVALAVRLHRSRGTAAGIRDEVRLALGPAAASIEVLESGGARWSAAPGAALPGSPEASVVVRVYAARPAEIDVRRIDRIVAAAKPAHVSHTVEVMAP